jgi:hypothetical protein
MISSMGASSRSMGSMGRSSMGRTKKVSTKKRGPKPSLHPMKNPRDYHEGEVPYSTSY